MRYVHAVVLTGLLLVAGYSLGAALAGHCERSLGIALTIEYALTAVCAGMAVLIWVVLPIVLVSRLSEVAGGILAAIIVVAPIVAGDVWGVVWLATGLPGQPRPTRCGTSGPFLTRE